MKKRLAEGKIMAKLVLSMNGAVLREIALSPGRSTIGRRPHNDIVLNHPGVSGRHARIGATDNDFYLEDLNSTNGTQVNGQPVRKHYLQHGDVICIARYELRYVSGPHAECGRLADAVAASTGALIRVLEGVGAGREVMLDKPMTTLGRPEAQIAVIVRQPGGYLITHIEGDAPAVNGVAVGADGRLLGDGDLIDMVGARVQFVQG